MQSSYDQSEKIGNIITLSRLESTKLAHEVCGN